MGQITHWAELVASAADPIGRRFYRAAGSTVAPGSRCHRHRSCLPIGCMDSKNSAHGPKFPMTSQGLSSDSAKADLETWLKCRWVDGIQIEKTEELQTLQVGTRNTSYEITVLHPETGEVLILGGKCFPKRTVAVLAGSSLGGSFLKQRGIYLGLRMEIYHDGMQVVTSPVQSIAIAASRPV